MMNCIFGVAGFAKEVEWLIDDVERYSKIYYKPDFFIVEDGNELVDTHLDKIPIISESKLFCDYKKNEINCFIGIGNPNIKNRLIDKINRELTKPYYPNLIHPSVSYDQRPNKIVLGKGNIICSKSVLTTDINIGNYVHINLDCTIGHDSIIHDYVTLSPGVHISGHVHIGKNVFIGTGVVVLEKIHICSNSIIGAGSTVIRNIVEPGVYVGSPLKKIK